MSFTYPTRAYRKVFAASLGLAALTLAATSCSGDTEASTKADKTSSQTKPAAAGGSSEFDLDVVPSVADLVPEEFKSGPISNAIYNDGAPQQFLEGDTLVGIQPDFAEAVSEVMGVTFELVPVGSFESIIPGLQSGRYDVAFADFGATKEREKVIDFVYQFDLGTSFAVKNGNTLSIESGEDLCGTSVGTLAGSYFLDQVGTLSSECESSGAQGIDIQSYPTQAAAVLAVSNGRVDSFATSSDQLAYAAEQDGAGITAQPFVYAPVPQAIGLPKGSALAPAIEAAIKELIRQGTYGEILTKWGIESSAITEDEVTISPIPGAM